MLVSGLCFIMVNTFVKLLGPQEVEGFKNLQHYPAHELVLARSIVSVIISFLVIKKKKIPIFGNNIPWLIIRGLSGMVALTIFFSTLHYLPIAIAVAVQYLAPIFTIIFAMVILRERVKLIQWGFIALSFLGVILILFSRNETTNGEISLFWLGLGIISATLSGLAYTAIMKLKETDEPITIVFYFPMVSIPFMIILCFFEFTIPQGIEWLYLLLIGIFTQLAQIALTKALHSGSAAKIIPIQYLGAIYAFLIGYFIFMESISGVIVLGIVLVISGVTSNAIVRKS